MTSIRPAALIVEEQPFVGLVASDILQESGFETFHAYDATGAAQLLDEHPEISVMVTEAELPGVIDGLELARRVSRERPHVRLVVTSARESVTSAEVPAGAQLLRKPFASGELRTLVAARSMLEEA